MTMQIEQFIAACDASTAEITRVGFPAGRTYFERGCENQAVAAVAEINQLRWLAERMPVVCWANPSVSASFIRALKDAQAKYSAAYARRQGTDTPNPDKI